MAKGYIQSYSGFIGADMSSDPRAVARNRLAYSVNMWRDYESDQGEAIETFPGFRIAVNALSANVHGLYHYRTRSGVDYVIAHFGKKLFAYKTKELAEGKYADGTIVTGLPLAHALADADSTGFVYNNNLYILDGSNYWVVTTGGIGTNEAVIAKNALTDPYIPTTYYNGKPYEQRNMLTNTVYQKGEVTYTDDYETISPRKYLYISNDLSNYKGKTVSVFDELNKQIFYGTFLAIPMEGNNVKVANANLSDIDTIKILADNRVSFEKDSLSDGLSQLNIYLCGEDVGKSIFLDNVPTKCIINTFWYKNGDNDTLNFFVDGDINDYNIHSYPYEDREYVINEGNQKYYNYSDIYEPAQVLLGVNEITENGYVSSYMAFREKTEYNGKEIECIKKIYYPAVFNGSNSIVNIKLRLHPNYFTTIKNGATFNDGNPDYKKTSIEAICGCTKAAVYDGRVFLTGNPDLPNTTFYSHRNLTGANDPAYFGVYNYFNDGVGNTPNVELLALPSMLMVLKKDTVSDGSIYYHVGQFNTDEDTMGLLPRIYPATTGAAGLGSVGENDPGERRGNTTCNFLDDPVFLSRRGLEAVGKEQVNLERAVTHRSSNVDRLLIKENLSEASIAEWKGYLVICVNGNMYLADSRHMSQHPDGSVQYEWYYLEGLKTYDTYKEAYKYLESSEVFTDDEWQVLNEKKYQLWPYGEDDDRGKVFSEDDDGMGQIDGVINGTLYYRVVDGVSYILERAGGELIGSGVEYPAKKIIAVGQHLIFGTDRGDLCIINTDKRGANVGGREVKADVIDYTWYTFAGVRYVSGCSTKLDDCDQRIYTKTTIPGTTTVRFKTMLNSSCRINSRVDGENWSEVGSAVNYLGRATSSELDFGDINFANFAFAGNDNNVVVVPEISRCWINKQYYVYSDGYAAPFGLYELSYAYKSGGKIRY